MDFINKRVFNDESGAPTGATTVSEPISCGRASTCRISATTDADWVDAGGIDQTVNIEGTVDGTNYNTAITGITWANASETKISGALDIRGYSKIRLVYTKKGCTAGTFDAWVHIIGGA